MERIVKGNEDEANRIIDAVEALMKEERCQEALQKIEVESKTEKQRAADDIEVRISFTPCLRFHQCGGNKPFTVEFTMGWSRDGHSTTTPKNPDGSFAAGGYTQIVVGTSVPTWAKAILYAILVLSASNREALFRRGVEFAQLEGMLMRFHQ